MQIRKHIPNAVTSMNLLCGTLGVIAAFQGLTLQAFFLMIAAAVFDFADGFAARALGAYSDIGKELDSLCDMVSFGVLPSIMLFKLMAAVEAEPEWYCYLPLLIAIFSALRLAKFNVDPRQKMSFIGLPTPMCAMFCASLCVFVTKQPGTALADICSSAWFVPALSLILSILLVCELPMFSLKISKDTPAAENRKRVVFLVLCLVSIVLVVLFHLHFSAVLFFIATAYIVENICFSVVKK